MVMQMHLQSRTKVLGTLRNATNYIGVLQLKLEKSTAILLKTRCCSPSPPYTMNKLWGGGWGMSNVGAWRVCKSEKKVQTLVRDLVVVF